MIFAVVCMVSADFCWFDRFLLVLAVCLRYADQVQPNPKFMLRVNIQVALKVLQPTQLRIQDIIRARTRFPDMKHREKRSHHTA